MTDHHPADWDPTTVVARYDQVRAHTELLAAPLSPEDQTVQSMPDVSPTKWHRAHVTWFFETFLLAEHESGFTPFQEQYWFLFNSYYESLGPRYARSDRGLVTRPGAHEVGDYRRNVDARVRDLVEQLDCGEGEDPLSALAQSEEPPPAVDGNLAAESFWEVLQKAESRRQPSRDEDI